MQMFLSGRAAEIDWHLASAWGSLSSGEGLCYSVEKSPSSHPKSSNPLPSIALPLLVA
jgi:hypothetical protein